MYFLSNGQADLHQSMAIFEQIFHKIFSFDLQMIQIYFFIDFLLDFMGFLC